MMLSSRSVMADSLQSHGLQRARLPCCNTIYSPHLLIDIYVTSVVHHWIPWRREWLPTPVFLPGESHEQRSLAGYSPWGHKVRHNWATVHSYILLQLSPWNKFLEVQLLNQYIFFKSDIHGKSPFGGCSSAVCKASPHFCLNWILSLKIFIVFHLMRRWKT